MTSHASTFGVRVAGLPATVLDQLVDQPLREALIAISGGATELTARAAALSDRCHDLIGALPDPAAKPKLVALRRTVHQLRDPARLLGDPLVAAALDAELAQDITEFGHAVSQHRADRAELPTVLAEAERSINARLREISAEPRFDQGLAHASPTLRDLLGRKPGRQELIRLAVYAARAAGKTSPFSTFTASGLGRFVPDGPAMRWTATEPPRSIVELDLSALRPLGEPRVRVNPSARLVGETVQFLGPADLLSLPLTPPLKHCLRAATARPTRTELTAGFPAPPEKAVEYLRSLVASGVILAEPDFDEHGIDPMRHIPGLDAIRESLTKYESANGTDRVALGSMLREQLGEPRKVLTEQSVIPGVVVEAGLPAWQDILADLVLACRVLAVFDYTLPFKLAIAAFLRERFPEGTSFDRFYAELARDGHEAKRLHPAAVAMNGLTATSSIPQVRELAELIAQVRRALPDRARLAEVLPGAPAWVRAPGSVAVYAQFDGDRLIVNAVNSGFGRARAQVRRLLRYFGEEPLPVDSVYPAAPNYLEFADTLGTSLNQRELTLDRLDYPPHPRLTVGVGADGLPALSDNGSVIRPVHGGLSYERQFPPVLALLVEAFGESPILLRPDQPLQHDAGAGRGAARVLHAPRLSIGRVVLRRATWVAQPGTLPRRAAGQSDVDFLLTLTNWLTEHGLPHRFFVSVLRMAAMSVADRSRKPMFVDIGSPPLVLAFERLARDPASAAVFSEVAPEPETAIVDNAGVPRVTEFVIELNCLGDGK